MMTMTDNVDIILVNPSISTTERYGKMAKLGSVTPPLGICYIASVLERNGYTVKIIDAEVQQLSPEETIAKIFEVTPKIVGITSTITSFHKSINLGREIRKKTSDLPLIIGGPYISAMKIQGMDVSFNYGVYGEGEFTVLELLDHLTNKRATSVTDIKGLIYQEDHKFKITPPREYIEDLDVLPNPARHLIPPLNLYRPNSQCYKKLPATTLITSRGCPYHCIFCDHSVFGHKYRAHSAKYVVNEIQTLVDKFDIREIWIVDDTFTINKQRVMEICDLIIQRGIKVSWSCLGRVNTVTPELLNKMKSAGCWMIAYGIESGNQEVMNTLDKGITIESVTQAIQWTNEAKILSKGYFMIGHPTDTISTIDQTIKFAVKLDLDYALFTITSPLPNTKLFEICSKVGKMDCTDLSKFSEWNAIYEPPNVTKEQIEQKFKEAYRTFYLRPHYIIKELLQIKSFEDFLRNLEGFISLVRL
jgi:anaerobic magnesium-protoporphyrin IX monomethyl ester cyclase